MFRALVRAIDGLFYQTTLITHLTIRQTYTHPDTLKEIRDYCRENGIEMKMPSDKPVSIETVVVADEDQFVLQDRIILIPDQIRKLIPAHSVDIAHFHAFPLDTSADILVMSEEPGSRRMAHYGLSSDDENFVLLTDLQIHDHMDDLIDRSGRPDVSTASAPYENMYLTSVIFDERDFLVVKITGSSRICISIPNNREEKDYALDNALSATAACMFARAILLTLRTTAKDISSYNEHDLRSTILALLLADRSDTE